MNENHPAYEKWRERINHTYVFAIVAPVLAIVTLAVILYYGQIVSIDTARTLGFLAMPSVFVGWFTVWFLEIRGTKRFHAMWKEEHDGPTNLMSAHNY